jgi:membrane fusion protein (multidrug efflux system)
VQRIPVRIALDTAGNSPIELRPGMSVIPTIETRSPKSSAEAKAISKNPTTVSGPSCHVKPQPVSLDSAALSRI